MLRVMGQADVVLRPPGRLIGGPVLGPDANFVYFEDHDTGSLRRIDVRSNAVDTVLRKDISEPALSSRGVVAYTFVDPRRTNEVCVEPLDGPGL